MKKKWVLALGLVLILFLVSLVGCSSNSTATVTTTQQEGIWVTGEGKVTVVPDIVNLSLGIQAQRPTVAEAQSEATQAMSKVMTALTTSGVAQKDIQTRRFSIQQITRWDEKNQKYVIIGYEVTNLVNAKIRDVGKAGTIIDAVAVAGGDLTRINSLSFSVDKPENYYGDAREKAIADAEAKAKQLASRSGVTLGKPTYISEGIQAPPPISPIKAERAGAVPAPTPISPGEMDITLNVQIVYAILK